LIKVELATDDIENDVEVLADEVNFRTGEPAR
jgi:hypothetical protein